MAHHEVHERIATLVGSNRVVLFMKGERRLPQCGFSATVVQILDELLPEYATVNVLADPAMREGIKHYSQWPTIPQLYIEGEFVGGCDIVRDLYASGELHSKLGVAFAPVAPPRITVTDAAATAVQRAIDEGGADAVAQQDLFLRLEISPRFEHGLTFSGKQPGDIEVEAGGLRFVMDPGSARRAEGLTLDFADGAEGAGFKIDNPNAPH